MGRFLRTQKSTELLSSIPFLDKGKLRKTHSVKKTTTQSPSTSSPVDLKKKPYPWQTWAQTPRRAPKPFNAPSISPESPSSNLDTCLQIPELPFQTPGYFEPYLNAFDESRTSDGTDSPLIKTPTRRGSLNKTHIYGSSGSRLGGHLRRRPVKGLFEDVSPKTAERVRAYNQRSDASCDQASMTPEHFDVVMKYKSKADPQFHRSTESTCSAMRDARELAKLYVRPSELEIIYTPIDSEASETLLTPNTVAKLSNKPSAPNSAKLHDKFSNPKLHTLSETLTTRETFGSYQTYETAPEAIEELSGEAPAFPTEDEPPKEWWKAVHAELSVDVDESFSTRPMARVLQPNRSWRNARGNYFPRGASIFSQEDVVRIVKDNRRKIDLLRNLLRNR